MRYCLIAVDEVDSSRDYEDAIVRRYGLQLVCFGWSQANVEIIRLEDHYL